MGIRAPMIATPNQFLALALFPHAFTRSEPFVRICSIGGGQNRTSSVNSCTRRVARFDTGSYRSIQYRRNIFTVNIWAHCNTQSERERERERESDRQIHHSSTPKTSFPSPIQRIPFPSSSVVFLNEPRQLWLPLVPLDVWSTKATGRLQPEADPELDSPVSGKPGDSRHLVIHGNRW